MLVEDDRSCYIIYGLAEAVDGLAVGFHIQLLQVCREAGQSLGIRKYCRAEIAACISLIDADQGIQKGCVLPDIGILSQSVGLCCAVHDRREYFRSECQGQNNCAYAGRGRITAADIVIHEECFQIISALRQRRSLTGNSKHVLGRIYASLTKDSLVRVSRVVPDLETTMKRECATSTDFRTAAASSGSTLEMNLASIFCLPYLFAQFSRAI